MDDTQYYDGYQQAWRLLGFYIDCSERGRDDKDEHEHNSHDADDAKSTGRCVRYLIWAAVSAVYFLMLLIGVSWTASHFFARPITPYFSTLTQITKAEA
jgi:hypothetical protein